MPSDKPGKKKLKQSRLPFSPIDPKTQKKRKLSSGSENQSSKALRTEAVLSKKEECILPKHPINIEIIEDSNQGTVIEEKENLKCKSTEKILKNVETPMEDSNDGIEVLEVIEKSDSPKAVSTSPKTELGSSSSVTKQAGKKNKTVNRSKRKRESTSTTSSSNIKKFFKDIGERHESSGKSEKSESKAESEREEQAKESSGKSKKSETKDEPERGKEAKESSEKSKKSETREEPERGEAKDEPERGEQAKESSEKSKESETREEPERDEHTKDKLDISNQCSKKSELSESSESNSTAATSDSGTPNSAGEEKTKNNKVISAPETPTQKSSLLKKKLTPKQKILEEMKKKKEEERLKLKLQKDQEKKEKEEEKQRLKEERQQKRIEEQEMKEREKEEKKQKREEERQRREEKKEEERLKKEEERLKKEGEKILAEEEEREKREKLKAKFAQFFVPKKVDSPNQQKETENSSTNDNFVHFQVKENMKIAPVVRRSLSPKEKEKLENILQTPLKEINYLQEIKGRSYVRGKSCKTFPPVDKVEDDEICEIISDEEDIDGTDVLEIKSCQTKRLKAKFLKFCENNRPAYYGTWSKKSAHINGRKPFKKEEIFDYDYDSDEDWEDMENGESLSDSDGEADDGGKEDSNQYEVDNEFFVPHGYLSDGEGEEDQENEEETKEENKEKDENVQKERLKQKQEEFEMEMKQKTKQLKPKVYGCVWLGDKSSHQAYDQLLKILMPYKSMVMFGTCPIDLGGKEMNNQELKENDDEDGHEEDSGKKFVKSFPEKAVPDLIRLIHGNRHSKLFLRREFSEYWKKKQEEEAENDSGSIAMRKIEPKIQEISVYGRFSENGVSLKYRTWFVSKEVREKYGLEDLSLNNSWQYTLPVKEWKHEPREDKQDKSDKIDESEESTVSKPQTKSSFTGTNLITKFTKVVSGEEEKKKLFNITSNNVVQSPCSSDASASPDNPGTLNNLAATPSTGKKGRNKVNLMAVPKEKVENLKSKNPIVSMFKNIEKEKTVGEKESSSANKDEQLECITLD